MSGVPVSMSTVERHASSSDLWVVINGRVYDLTSFVPDHPGGVKVIAQYAGRDASAGFNVVHNAEILTTLPPEADKGPVDQTTIQAHHKLPKTSDGAAAASANGGGGGVVAARADVGVDVDVESIPMERCLNVADMQAVAARRVGREGWDYYMSAADDEITMRENRAAFLRIWMRPRVLVNVARIDMTTQMLGETVAFPCYVSACALGKLAHPDGEVAITRGCGAAGVIQMCPTLGSCTLEEMAAARLPKQTQWFQLYVNNNRALTATLIQRAERAGMRALCVTVDAPMLGRRERDMRNKFSDAGPAEQKGAQRNRSQGTARAISGWIDASLNWNDVAALKALTTLPIILKGIQCGADAVKAAEHGVAGIVVSNHGGRQADFSRSGIETLVEVVAELKAANYADALEIYMDGGVRRGTDIFKAIALGCRAVGIGRPSLFGLAAYGADGVERVLDILREELMMTMTMMGCPTLKHITHNMVITDSLAAKTVAVPLDHLYETNYQPLTLVTRSRM